MKPPRDEPISIRGARVHNLQGVDCDIPRNRLVVITGPSGSGKSSLAFDTLYAEGQRRYVESLSAYARQFLDQMEKPDVESVTGLSPAIAIEQRTTVSHPRSTVGTVTEIYDHLRVLFAALGRPHCPKCQRPVMSQTTERIAERLWQLPPGTTLSVLAPVVRGRKGAFRKELAAVAAEGYLRVRIDGRVVSLEERISLDPRRNHRVEVLIDRLALRPGAEKRLLFALEKALHLAGDVVMIVDRRGRAASTAGSLACAVCDVSLSELSPRAFSFNSPYGACPVCEGLGLALGRRRRRGSSPTRTSPWWTARSIPGSATGRASCTRPWTSWPSGSISRWRRPFAQLSREGAADPAARRRHAFPAS